MAGNHYVPPTKPKRQERWRECPITGIEFPESEGIWSRGRLVHPLAVDDPGYKEPPDLDYGPDEEPRNREREPDYIDWGMV